MAPVAVHYVESDVPEGVTLVEWRASREAERREARQREREARRFGRRVGALRAIGRRPALLACCVAGVHCAHVALGMPALEGVEEILLAAASSPEARS